MLIVGAGLSGLSAARHLHRAGMDVLVVDAATAVGGRVRTELREGFQLDRGFQLFNPAYPEPPRLLDLAALDLQSFSPGALVVSRGRRHRLVDPRRDPGGIRGLVSPRLGSLREQSALVLLSARNAVAPVSALMAGETTTAQLLREWHLTGDLGERLLRRFLAGVFLERELTTSSIFFNLIWRTFVRGTPAVPSTGMRAIPEQLAAGLPAGSMWLRERVTAIEPYAARLADGREIRATRGVIVATDGAAAARLLPSLSPPVCYGVTTIYHAMTTAPLDEPILVLDGDEELVVNTVVMSAAAPSYAPAGQHLVATSVLGADHGDDLEARVRARLAVLYDTDTSGWRHLHSYAIPAALPAMPPPLDVRKPVHVADGTFVCGDHRDTSSIQGAMVSGRRAARAVLAADG